MRAATMPDRRTSKWHDVGKELRAQATAAPDVRAAALHAKYARVVAVRVGIRFADDPAARKDITEALGLVA